MTSPTYSRSNPLETSTYALPTRERNDYSSDEEDTLPYPLPLPRSDFLDPNFHAQTYLSTLGRNRHQALEDLRSDLRSRSQLLSRELLDLVNNNYEEFLSLGSTLKGGDERVENVRLGVLGFQRVVEGVKDVVAEREREVRTLLEERRGARKDMLVGRKLLEVDERLGELEARLMIEPGVNGNAADEDDDDEDDDDDDDDYDNGNGLNDENNTPEARAANAVVGRLRRHAQSYLLLQHLVGQVGPQHPFITAQEPRTMRIRNTLLLDLRAALRQAKKEGTSAGTRTLRLVAVYRALGEGEELVNALKGT